MSEQEAQEFVDSPPPRKPLDWEFRLGRYLVLLLLIAVGGGCTLAMFISIYRSITAPPKVWRVTAGASPSGSQQLKRSRIRACRQHLERLHAEQGTETTALWYRMRKGHRGHLTLWAEWSRDWKRRMNRIQAQCAMSSTPNPKARPGKAMPLRACTKQFAQLNQELQSQSKKLWHKARSSTRSLKGWQDWSRSWQRKMLMWQKSCPIHGDGDTAIAFRRAHSKMMALQRKQEKALLTFFRSSSGLFRDIQQSLHSLKEELQ